MAVTRFLKGERVNVYLPASIRRNLPFFVARDLARDNPAVLIEYRDADAIVIIEGAGTTLRVPDYCVTRHGW
jgi:hypothetical protein